MAVVIAHALLLSPRFSEGLAIVKSKVIVRTFPTDDPSLGYGASSLDVLGKYFGVLLQPIFVGVEKPFYWTLIALSLAAAALICTKSAKNRALGVAFFVSIAAPLSWFVLAKGHSFVHPFLNPVLWNVPTVLLGLVCVATLVSYFAKRAQPAAEAA
ncbi:hypothetical protein [Caballeronia cordobensis]|uniref:hypothetical protein n=1 Tax=Caballeronia cordobensis TaxID=1353886 RepID=UPI001186F958